jgi:MFS family permease
MRDGVRDASIYESSDQQRVGSSMGMRKFMACFGSFLGGIAAFFILKFFAKTNQSTVFSVMYFSTIIPVSISMFILVFYVKDLFQEKYKNQTKIEDEEFIVPSRNIIPGNLLISSLVALGIGIFLQRILSTIVNSFQWGTTQLLNIYLSTGASWMIKLKTIIYSFWTQLPYQATAIKVLSIVAIAMLVMELFFVKIYPNFFDKDSQRRNIFIWLNFIVFQMFGFLLTLCWSSLSPSFSIITALKMTFFQYGLNATIIIPLIILFRLVFYALYKKMQPTLEYYSKDLVKYDKIITLTFILAFSKYSDIFVFKHVIESCGWNVMYTPLLYAVLYLIFGIFAYILGRLSDGFLQKYSMFLLVTVNIVFNIVAATLNITHPMLRGFFSIIALISYGAYVGLTDSVLVSLVSKAIPVDRLLGTLLGLFYLLIGVGNTCASYFIGTVFVSTTQAYKMAVIPSILGFLFVLWNRKTLQENN